LSTKNPEAPVTPSGSGGKFGQFDFEVSRSIISTESLTPIAVFPLVIIILKSPKIGKVLIETDKQGRKCLLIWSETLDSD
jgi:hypothetical protein